MHIIPYPVITLCTVQLSDDRDKRHVHCHGRVEEDVLYVLEDSVSSYRRNIEAVHKVDKGSENHPFHLEYRISKAPINGSELHVYEYRAIADKEDVKIVFSI